MDCKFTYRRQFLMLKQEDKGFGEGGEPSGYVKVEIKENKGKLTALVQNLRINDKETEYKLYLIKCGDRDFKAICMGTFSDIGGRGELVKEFIPENVSGSGISADQINSAVVAARYSGNGNKAKIAYPLISLKCNNVDWRNSLTAIIQAGPVEYKRESNEIDNESNIKSIYNGKIESKYIPKTEFVETGPGLKSNIENDLSEKRIETIKIADESDNREEINIVTRDMASNESVSSMDEHKNNSEEKEEKYDDTYKRDIDQQDLKELPDETGMNKHGMEQIPKMKEYATDGIRVDSSDLNKFNEILDMLDNDKAWKITKDEGNNEQLSKDLSETCPLNQKDKASDFCSSCMANKKGNDCVYTCDGMSKNVRIIDRIKNSMEHNFISCEPFGSKRSDYQWWRVNSPVDLNNILCQYNIRNSLLFNPKAMLAYFKYRHLIVGIYTNNTRQTEYIVYGVPGVYGMEDRPFGEASRWAQVEGNRIRYGAFGYWIIYIDVKTGRVVNIE